MNKPRLTTSQILNMNVGFLGIQFGFALQNANVSRIFETLGAKIDEIAILWIAAPATGLLVQPIVGYLSDRTWSRLGRRRPFFLLGAIAAAAALCIMPHSPVLWFAALMLWILDASINVSMEPFRALVADMLPVEQHTTGFSAQSFFIGIGAVVASALPYIFTNVFNVSNIVEPGKAVPDSVLWSFYIGAIAFLGAVLWTVFSTKEYPPDNIEEFHREKAAAKGIFSGTSQLIKDFFAMPTKMRALGLVQFFTWFALFAMWIYAVPAVTSHIYGTTDTSSALYNAGANWVGICFAAYSAYSALAAFLLPYLAQRIGRKATHAVSLLCGALGLASMYFIADPTLLLLSMAGIGIAWASILAMPYAMLADALPADKMGVYMGMFNFFITIPQIIAAGTLGFLVSSVFDGTPIYAMFIGAISFVIAAVTVLFIHDAPSALGERISS